LVVNENVDALNADVEAVPDVDAVDARNPDVEAVPDADVDAAVVNIK